VPPCMLEISNSRRNIPKYSELESQGAGDLATARQPSRREVTLLSLTILFVLGGVALFTCYAIKLTDQIDRYLSNSIRVDIGYSRSARAE
jgi:type VI protein secretion system component VasF